MLAMIALFALASQTVTLTPTDDVWVYPHASDQDSDVFLRVWGVDGAELASKPDEMGAFSYSYLKFDLSKVPAGSIKEATLTLTHVPTVAYTLDMAQKHPLTARPVKGDWTEKKWVTDKATDFMPKPGKENVLGTGAPTKLPSPEAEFPIVIDLKKGTADFQKYLDESRSSNSLAISISTDLDVMGAGSRTLYKLFSKSAEESKRPVLKLVIE